MALVLLDRAKETTIVLGTTVSAILLGAATGYQSFAGVGNANTTYYCIAEQAGTNWEVGLGTYTSATTIITRAATPLSSSNAGASVSFPAGTKDIFIVYPSAKGVWLDGSGNAIGLGTPAAFVGTNITGTATGLTVGTATTATALTTTNNYQMAALGVGVANAVAGTIVASGNITTSSDERLKSNIVKIENALDKVSELNGYTFDRTDIDCDRQTGVIAQEVLEVLPEAVIKNENGIYSVAYGNMIGLLIEAIKEQQQQIENLKRVVNL